MDHDIHLSRRVMRLAVSLGLLLGVLRGSTPMLAGTVSLERVLPGSARAVLESNGDRLYQVGSPPIHLWQWNPAPGAYYATNNVAKNVLDWEIVVRLPREQLRPVYGAGFGGAPLTGDWTPSTGCSTSAGRLGAAHVPSHPLSTPAAAGATDV
jgi:hypothetical protein